MKYFTTLLMVIFTQVTVFAQNEQVKITGKVVEAGEDTGLEFATVSVLTPEDELVTGSITDLDGSFQIPVDPGTYKIKAQFVGYGETIINDIKVTPGQGIYKAGNIGLSPTASELTEVVITAEKLEMEVDLDKRVFNVGENLSNTGRMANEVLDNLPSVNVDLDGNVSLRGSQNVRILVDGKPSGLIGIDNTDGLRSLNGDMIEKVEVITNPSARYDAAGQAGIINIVLKKEKRSGLNGAFNINAGVPSNYGAGVNMNYRKDWANLFINYGVNYRKNPGQGSSFQQFTLPDTSFITRRDRQHLRGGLSNNIRFGSDFILNEKNTITASALYRRSDEENNTDLWYYDYDINETLVNSVLRTDNEGEDDINEEYELSYRRTFDTKGQELTALVQYRNNWEVEKSDLVEYEEGLNPILNQRSTNEEGENNWLMQADYIHPLGGDGKFETGYRGTLRNINNDYIVEELDEQGIWQSLPGFTNDFSYDEYIHAGYAMAGNKSGRWSYQAGLRVESTQIRTYLAQTDEENIKEYVNFFPSLFLNYELNNGSTIQTSYSRRIDRPWFRLLNPFSSFSDARNIRTGNPDLDPEFTDSYELGYMLNYETGNFYVGGYYRYTTGKIERINFVADDGITYSQPQNLSTEDSWGVEINGTQDIIDGWTVNGNINLFRSVVNGFAFGEDLSAEAFSMSGRIQSTLKLPGLFEAQLTGFYRAPRNEPQGRRQSIYALDIGILRDILNNNGTIALSIRDVFNTRKYRGISEGANFYQESEFQWRSRQATLTLTYRLNQKKQSGRGGRGGDFGGDNGGF